MDYGTGQRLYKWQWDLIHDPVSAPLLPSDSTGQSNTFTDLSDFDKFRHTSEGVEGTLSFISPANKIITIPGDVRQVTFNTGDEIGVRSDCFSGFDIFPFGSLRSFTTADGKLYNTRIMCNDQGIFSRYAHKSSDGTITSYIDNLTKELEVGDRDAVVVFPVPNQGNLQWVGRGVPMFVPQSEVQSNYLARGPREPYYTHIWNQGGGDTVLATFRNNDPFSATAEAFLQSVLDFEAASSTLLTFAYVHAHQMTQYPQFTANCSWEDITNINFEEFKSKIRNQYDRLRPNWSSDPNFDPVSQFTFYEYDLWKNSTDGSIYKQFESYSQDVLDPNWILALPETNQGAVDLFEGLEQLSDLEPCVFNNLSNPVRVHMIKVISQKDEIDEDYVTTIFSGDHDSEEHILNYLLSSTPADSAYYVINAFENDQDLLWRCYEKLNNPYWFLWMQGDIDSQGPDDFIGNLYTLYTNDNTRDKFRVQETDIIQSMKIHRIIASPGIVDTITHLETSFYRLFNINQGSVTTDAYYAHVYNNDPS
ncbi:MAG: hypothetical protein AAFQ92_28790, partial [Bacteroidota bacterium]